jgi:RimJ/RimL family protein N-acetyltransferase
MMRHDVGIDGVAFRLRPITTGDAAFIVALRNDARLSRFLHRSAPDVAAQRRWFDAYFERPGDYYFIVERRADGSAEGAIGIYDLDAAARRAEWGRWVLRAGSLAAAESAWLVYRAAFDVLDLDLVYCRTATANQRVVSFHNTCGLTTYAMLPGHAVLDGGVPHDVVEHHLTRDGWPTVAPRLLQHAERAAAVLARQ